MYNFENRKIYSLKSGKLVAGLNEENQLVFEPGMLPAHKANLETWMKENGMEYPFAGTTAAKSVCFDTAAGKQNSETVPEQTVPDQAEAKPEKVQELQEAKKEQELQEAKKAERADIGSVPFELLPAFDRRLGVDTPGLRDYIRFHGLDQGQQVTLIRRLEKGK